MGVFWNWFLNGTQVDCSWPHHYCGQAALLRLLEGGGMWRPFFDAVILRVARGLLIALKCFQHCFVKVVPPQKPFVWEFQWWFVDWRGWCWVVWYFVLGSRGRAKLGKGRRCESLWGVGQTLLKRWVSYSDEASGESLGALGKWCCRVVSVFAALLLGVLEL